MLPKLKEVMVQAETAEPRQTPLAPVASLRSSEASSKPFAETNGSLPSVRTGIPKGSNRQDVIDQFSGIRRTEENGKTKIERVIFEDLQ